jgi:hypothetical protein
MRFSAQHDRPHGGSLQVGVGSAVLRQQEARESAVAQACRAKLDEAIEA